MIRTKKTNKDTLNKAELYLILGGLEWIKRYSNWTLGGRRNKEFKKVMKARRNRIEKLQLKLAHWTPHQKKKVVPSK